MKHTFLSIFAIITLFFSFHLAETHAAPTLFESIKDAGLTTIGANAYGYANPNSPKPIGLILADAITIALEFLGIIFLSIIVYAGFRWLTAGGNDDNISKARGLIFNGIIGLIIVLSAYAVTIFIIENVVRATYAETYND